MFKWRGQEVKLLRKRDVLLGILVCILLFSCLFNNQPVSAQTSFNSFVQQVSRSNSVGLWRNLPVEEVPDLYLDESYVQQCEKFLQELRSFDWASLTPDQQVAYKSLEFFLTTEVEYGKYNSHDYFITQINLYQLQLPYIYLSSLSIRSQYDAENCIQRYSQFDQLFAQLEKELEKREKAGIIPPRFVLDKTHELLVEFNTSTIESETLYKNFEACVSRLPISSEEKEDLCTQAKEALGDHMIRAYRDLADYIQGLKKKTKVKAGVWQLPDGDKYYAYMLKKLTSSDLSPEEVYELGLREVARLQGELRPLLDQLGYAGLDIGPALEELDKKNRITDEKEIISILENTIEEANKLVPQWIAKAPRITTPVRVTRSGVLPAYLGQDGFYIDLSFPQTRHTFQTTIYHEVIPGHALGREFFKRYTRRYMPYGNYGSFAFDEGWALYSERLAYEMGAFTDPESIVGYLQYQLLRATRLVVDTGLHYKHWSKEKAIEYFSNTTGLGKMAKEEIERYVVWPGQACTYMLGQRSFLKLREKAESELGDQFDLRDFHYQILTYGQIPEPALELVIEQYIGDNMKD